MFSIAALRRLFFFFLDAKRAAVRLDRPRPARLHYLETKATLFLKIVKTSC